MNDSELLTRARFLTGESESDLLFNSQIKEELRRRESRSVFEPGFVRNQGESWFRRAVERIESSEYSELCRAMISMGCNKPTSHNYTQFYDEILASYRDVKLRFLEVGIGTTNPDVPSHMGQNYSIGSSLRGWKKYFNRADQVIHGADVDSRILFSELGIRTGYLDQTDPCTILAYIEDSGFDKDGLDFVLDDGLHMFHSNMALLISVWPYIKRNGLYLIEDMSEQIFRSNIDFISMMSFDADVIAVELPSYSKADNRIIVLQKR